MTGALAVFFLDMSPQARKTKAKKPNGTSSNLKLLHSEGNYKKKKMKGLPTELEKPKIHASRGQ